MAAEEKKKELSPEEKEKQDEENKLRIEGAMIEAQYSLHQKLSPNEEAVLVARIIEAIKEDEELFKVFAEKFWQSKSFQEEIYKKLHPDENQ